MSKQLKHLVDAFEMTDVHVKLSNDKIFTWIRPGKKSARLDRIYVSEDLVSKAKNLDHLMHVSDHKALVLTMELDTAQMKVVKFKYLYWKLNTSVLEDVDYEENGRVRRMDSRK